MKLGKMNYEKPNVGCREGSTFKEVRKGSIFAAISWIEHRKDRLYKIARVYIEDDALEEVFKRTVISILENIKNLMHERNFEFWGVSQMLFECN